MNYYQFSAEDLAADEFFKEWVCTPTPETETFWRDFLREFPERYYHVMEARELVQGLWKVQHQFGLTQKAEKIWNRIENTLADGSAMPVVNGWSRWVWQAAAALVLIAGAGWLVLHHNLHSQSVRKTAQIPNEWVETLNEASQIMHIQLADGSRIDLQEGGRLRYRKDLAGLQREVYLTGEAFFEVKKNPKKPFVVYANGLVTKVLGTSFQIKAPTDAPTVTVDVKSGRVSVYALHPGQPNDQESKGVVLTSNQKAVFQRDRAILNKTLVESPRLLLPKETVSFVFEDARVSRVFQAIEQSYGVDVVYDEEIMQHCTLTLNLNEETLFQKLTVICKVLNADYKLIDGQIVIYTKEGCPKTF
ncbi:FecR family protein [Larkinella bovis]|uniref:FecR family protein n=1 Tax=Larkinella bovis TaxID=683041 RepID=A0ABW0IMW2_9BACT